MTVIPLHVAKIVNAERAVEDVLRTHMCPYPDNAARQVVSELRKLGWTFPGWRDDDVVPQPSTSTPEGRRRARELFADTLAARRGTAETGDDDE